MPEKFFDQFGEVLDIVPPLPGEEALHASFKAMLDAAARDPQIKGALVATAVDTEREVIARFFEWKDNSRPGGVPTRLAQLGARRLR